MPAGKGSQKFTKMEAKIKKILSLERITPSDIEPLNPTEKGRLMKVLSDILNNLKGIERDKFCKKIEQITPDTAKNQLWESNHMRITWAISVLIKEYGRMPTQTELADKTELSRQTIHKHLKEYATHPQHLEQIEQFRFMTSKVLANVFQYAVNGDMGAAKLYFSVMGFMGAAMKEQPINSTLVQNQNNYIQINGTVLSQETLKHLNPEQLNVIETMLKAAIPQPEFLQTGKLEY